MLLTFQQLSREKTMQNLTATQTIDNTFSAETTTFLKKVVNSKFTSNPFKTLKIDQRVIVMQELKTNGLTCKQCGFDGIYYLSILEFYFGEVEQFTNVIDLPAIYKALEEVPAEAPAEVQQAVHMNTFLKGDARIQMQCPQCGKICRITKYDGKRVFPIHRNDKENRLCDFSVAPVDSKKVGE